MPDQMRLMLHGADVFTLAWMLMGFESFCLATVDQPELVAALMDSLADAQINALAEAMRVGGDRIGIVLYSDDIAYTEGLMLAPSFFREYLLPVLKRVAALGPPLVYHSDGRLYDVFDDLAECRHPRHPAARSQVDGPARDQALLVRASSASSATST